MTITKRHGLRYKSEYRVWWNIKDRCCNPKNARYSSYQGMLCAEWHDPVVFCEAVGKRPTRKHTLDRIDVTKGYEPGNVRWATAKIQCRNRTDTHLITYRGYTRAMVEWCERLNRDYLLVKVRIRNGWSDVKAISTPTNKPFAGTVFRRSVA